MEGTLRTAAPEDVPARAPRFIPETMFVGDDGEYYCQGCGEARTMTVTYPPRLAGAIGRERARISVVCRCEREREEKEEAELRRSRALRIEEELRKESMLPPRYRGSSFLRFSADGVAQSVIDARAKLEDWCSRASQMLSRNEGVWISGGPGLGKTELMACMANELMRGGRHTVLFTSCLDFAMSARFGQEPSMLDRITKVDFLFLDDVGAERYRTVDGGETWIQEKVYEIVNARYNAMLPVVCSSNYTLGELQRDRGLALPVVDRLAEMTGRHRVALDGRSWRLRRA